MQYARPRNLAQAIDLLDGLGTGAMVIAGGQDLMPFLNYGKISPSVFVDLSALAELNVIEETPAGLSIGALTVHRDIQRNAIINAKVPILSLAASLIGGGRQVHNQGTIGGNIAAMHALYDIVPALLALGAKVEIVDVQGARAVALVDLLTDTSHQLGTRSILTRVLLNSMDPADGWAYEKLKISTGSYGSANAAAVVSAFSDEVRVVIGAVTEQPVDLTGELAGVAIDDVNDAIDRACQSVITRPLSDQRGDAEYRQAMAAVVAKRAVKVALTRRAM